MFLILVLLLLLATCDAQIRVLPCYSESNQSYVSNVISSVQRSVVPLLVDLPLNCSLTTPTLADLKVVLYLFVCLFDTSSFSVTIRFWFGQTLLM
jgi:hypothetical protein